MYKAQNLIDDAAKRWSLLTRRSGELPQVWDAVNRYITATLEKKLTLHINGYCKIGWKVEEVYVGKPKWRPHFQFNETFARQYNLDARALKIYGDKALTTSEDFNYSKAAIRYSTGLTKDAVFLGVRSLFQMLGEVLSSGQRVSIELEVGTLTSVERRVNFTFGADFYLQAGLEVPAAAPRDQDYRPSATFVPPTKDALSLTVLGNRSMQQKAASTDGWAQTPRAPEAREELLEDTYRPSTAAPLSQLSATMSLPPGFSKKDFVFQEALDRHIAKVAEEAAMAIAEKAEWDGYVQRCVEEEKKESDWRRSLLEDYSTKLSAQIEQSSERKELQKLQKAEKTPLDCFPNFATCPEMNVYDYMRERKRSLKEDLDQQVDIKQRLQEAARQRDLSQEAQHVDIAVKELALLKLEESAKKEYEKVALLQAWAKDKHLNHVKKVIDEYSKCPERSELADFVPKLGPSGPRQTSHNPSSKVRGGMKHQLQMQLHDALQDQIAQLQIQKGGSSTKPSPRPSHNPLVLPLGDLPTQEFGDGPPSSRPPTGSVRRMPLGAAGSLALHKEKLSARRR